jgi:hypothetical protein
MGALGQLRKLYTLQFWLFIIALIFIVIAFILLLVVGVSTIG